MRRWILPLALLLAFAATASAQVQTGQIFGKVTDTSNAVLPGVTVTASSPVLLQPLTAVTSETGTYQFPNIPIGTYTIKFELTGFKAIVRENVRIEIGFNAQINAQLEVGALTETVEVSASAPLVDVRDTGRGTRFNQDALQNIPTARDPWVMIEQAAGTMMDRENVGGSMSGQQSNFVARGSLMSQQKWFLDGIDITDMNATGGSPVYFDFDAFEEMQVSTGGADVTMQSPGVAVNLVTKSGSDAYRGSARYYVTDQAFEAVNLTNSLRMAGANSGNPIQNIKDWGGEIGGPVKKGRMWAWASWGKQNIGMGVNNFYQPTAQCQAMKAQEAANPLSNSVSSVWNCLNTDLTTLGTGNVKLNAAISKDNQFGFYFNYASKERNARNASDTHPIETTWNQHGVADTSLGSPWWKTGAPKTYVWSDRHVFSDRFMLELQYGHVGNNFSLDFHDPSLANVQATYDMNTGMYGRSYYAQQIVRPTDNVNLTGNYFLPGTLGGDNAIKFGFNYRNDEAYTGTHYGGNAWAVFSNGAPVEAWLYRDATTDYFLRNRSFYVQDNWTRKRVNVTVGIRWDYQNDYVGAANVPASPFYNQVTEYGQPFNQLPAANFGGYSNTPAWKNFSPRAGVSYDITGDGRNVAKFNYSRYVNQLGSGGFGSYYNPVKTIELDYPWTDLNHDGVVQANEIDMRGGALYQTSGYNYQNPSQLTTTSSVNPNVTAPTTNEFIFTFDKQLSTDFAVSASYIYRKYTNYTILSRPGLSASNWTQKTYTPTCGSAPAGALCQPVTYYSPNFAIGNMPTVFTNLPDYYQLFKGFETAFRKRMSQNWQFNGSFSYSTAPVYYPTPASYNGPGAGSATVAWSDPTNIAMANGAQWAEQSTSSGLDNVFVNTPWIFRLSGSYTTPWQQIGVAAFYNARAGYPFEQTVNITNRGNGASSGTILLNPIGDVRLPAFQEVDFRLDKPFTFGTTKIMASMDIFNLFNSNTILAQNRTQNASNANVIKNILSPLVVRFGARITF